MIMCLRAYGLFMYEFLLFVTFRDKIRGAPQAGVEVKLLRLEFKAPVHLQFLLYFLPLEVACVLNNTLLHFIAFDSSKLQTPFLLKWQLCRMLIK